MVSKRSLSRKRRKLAAGASAVALMTLGMTGFGPVEQAAASNEARPRLGDPDQYYGSDGYWYTYATSWTGRACYDSGASKNWRVPVIRSTTSSISGLCIAGDAMQGGAGDWAHPGSPIWAPSISFFNGTYFLHYSATKAGTVTSQFPDGQKCIGRATATNPMGPFSNQQEFACPPSNVGRWALDPDVFVGTDGVFLTYRDDAITSGAETGISAVQLNSNGHAIWNTRRDLLLSTDVGWEHSARTGKNIIENPSFFQHEGTYYLLFSGNDWKSNDYAVGIASCGPTALPASRCKPLVDVNRPYYAYSASAHNPVRNLPGNHPGPGAMASTSTYKGTSTNVTWHWYAGGEDRRIKSGAISNSGGYFNVT